MPEIGLADRGIVGQFLRRAAHADAAGLDDQAVACDLESRHHILLDQQDRDARAVDLQQRFAQPLDQPRGEPERQFIDHQKLRT